MNKTTIYLTHLKLKTFTEQNIIDYCLLNNINPDNIIKLDLSGNKLADISSIKLFKNLEILSLEKNQIKDISVLKNLNNLKTLYIDNTKIEDISVIQYLKKLINLGIRNLELESDQIKYIKKLNKLEKIWCEKGFKDISILKQLNKKIIKKE